MNTMYKPLPSMIALGVAIGLAASGCSSERAAVGLEAEQIKEIVSTRYDRFAASGGEVCEQ
jgi:hypothetical protein